MKLVKKNLYLKTNGIFSFFERNAMNKRKLLTKQQITELKAKAHHLNPVVMIGQKGLTDAVICETDAALRAHQLIKVRVLGDDREERIEMCNALLAATESQLIQHIGKLLVLYRENEEEQEV